MPSRLEGSYACFDHFLEQVTRTGEPLGYPASQLKVTHVHCCCVQLLNMQGSEPCVCAALDRSHKHKSLFVGRKSTFHPAYNSFL